MQQMSSDFITCKKCDFEWHGSNGPNCPVCAKKMGGENVEIYSGGMFGTGRKAGRIKMYYQGLGLIALVYFLYLVLGSSG